MKRINLMLIVSMVALLISACNEQKYPGFNEDKESGLFYKIHTDIQDTVVANIGDVMSAYMTYRTMNDSVFGGSQAEPFDVPMIESTYKGDVFNALALLHAGDSATFIMNSDSFFMKTVGAPRPEFLDSASVFYLDVHIVDIKTKADLEMEAQENAARMQAMEQEVLLKYFAENNISMSPDEMGLYIIENKKGNGVNVEVGKFIEADIVAIALTGDKFIDTYTEGKPYTIEVGTGQLGMGFETAITKMSEGGKLTLISPSSMAFGERGIQGYIPPYSPVVYEIEVIKVISKEEMNAKQEKEKAEAAAQAAKQQGEEQAKIDAYVQANRIMATPTASGLIFIDVLPGTGEPALPGQKVKVHYTGYLLSGKKFDSSVDRGQAFEFVIGQQQVIAGWDEALAMMRVGGKAKIILPSRIAYGERGAGANIPPFAPLMFEVELLEIVK